MHNLSFQACFHSFLILAGLAGFSLSCQPEEEQAESVLDGRVSLKKELEEIPSVGRRDTGYAFDYVTIDDSVSIYLLRKGQGVPMVLLNGGPGNSSHSFLPYFDRASDFCELILYDPRGVGMSDWKPGKGYSTDQLISDLEKIRIRLGIDKWVVAGWSFGGLAAQHYVLKYPEKVLGMVLINSSYSADFDFSDHSYPDHFTKEERDRIREIYSVEGSRVVPVHSDQVSLPLLQEMVYNGYLNGDWKRQFFYKPTREEMAAVALYEWHHDKNYNEQVTEDGFEKDLGGQFTHFRLPVLLFYGKYDMTFSAELPAKMAEEFPNSTLVLLNRSSHNPFKEEPDLFFSELERFLSTLQAGQNR